MSSCISGISFSFMPCAELEIPVGCRSPQATSCIIRAILSEGLTSNEVKCLWDLFLNLPANVPNTELWRGRLIKKWNQLSKNSFRKFFTKSLVLPQLCGLFEKCINKFYNKSTCYIYATLIDSFLLHNLNFCKYAIFIL